MRKLLTLLLAMAIVLSGCSSTETEVERTWEYEFTTYGAGIGDDGYYENLSEHPYDVSSFDFTVTEDEVMEYLTEQAEIGEDEYLELVAEEYLVSIGAGSYEGPVKAGDTVLYDAKAYIDDERAEEYDYEDGEYELTEDSEYFDEISGKEIGDTFTYTETVTDESEEAESEETESEGTEVSYTCTITGIIDGDILQDKYVLEKSDEFKEYFGKEVSTVEELLAATRTQLAIECSGDIIIENLSETIEAPEEYVEQERYRQFYRLKMIDMTYDEYLEQAGKTDEEITETIRKSAARNYVVMLIGESQGIEVTEEDVEAVYGSDYKDNEEKLTMPYMKVITLRSMVSDYIQSVAEVTSGGEDS